MSAQRQVAAPGAPSGPHDPLEGRPLDGRLAWGAVALATLVAAALRLPFLSHQSLWLDEVLTREIVGEPSLAALWRHVEATESTPPLYYALSWLLGARSPAALRAISALALVAAVPVAYLAFRRLVGERAALATAAIVSVSPMLVWYALDARAYALLVLFALLSIWSFSALLERACKRRYALWAAASVACLWTHYFAIFVIVVEALLLLVEHPAARRATALWTVLVGLCAAPLIPLVASQSGDERAAFIEHAPLAKRVAETARQLAMGPNVPRAWLEAAALLLASVATAFGAWWAWRAGARRRALVVLAASVIGAPLLLALLGISDRFYARNVIVAVPLLAALAAPALLRLRAVPLALYLLLATATSVWVMSDWRYEQADWRSAIARAESIDPAAPVIAVTASAAPVVQLYLGRPLAHPPVLASQAWVLVEPQRAAGQRALAPAPLPALPAFVPERAYELHGFRLVLERAERPTALAPVGPASVFAAR